ncbi:MAG: hypothetical protein AVDCRST_MAG38-167, partial [uncultured Solirubrobacteraceae bacterium]
GSRHGSVTQARHPLRRRPHRGDAARRGARLHELQRLHRDRPAQPAARRGRGRSRVPAHRQGREGLVAQRRRLAQLPRRGSRRRQRGGRDLRRPGAGSVPRGPRGHRRRAQAGRHLRRRARFADHQVPVEVQRRGAAAATV